MRFKVGDKVEVRDVDGWHQGTVVHASELYKDYKVQYGTVQVSVPQHRVRSAEEK